MKTRMPISHKTISTQDYAVTNNCNIGYITFISTATTLIKVNVDDKYPTDSTLLIFVPPQKTKFYVTDSSGQITVELNGVSISSEEPANITEICGNVQNLVISKTTNGIACSITLKFKFYDLALE